MIGALRANYSRLFETARMVIVKSKRVAQHRRALDQALQRPFRGWFVWIFLGMPIAIWIGHPFRLATAGVARSIALLGTKGGKLTQAVRY